MIKQYNEIFKKKWLMEWLEYKHRSIGGFKGASEENRL